jgi:hypothetical protein
MKLYNKIQINRGVIVIYQEIQILHGRLLKTIQTRVGIMIDYPKMQILLGRLFKKIQTNIGIIIGYQLIHLIIEYIIGQKNYTNFILNKLKEKLYI